MFNVMVRFGYKRWLAMFNASKRLLPPTTQLPFHLRLRFPFFTSYLQAVWAPTVWAVWATKWAVGTHHNHSQRSLIIVHQVPRIGRCWRFCLWSWLYFCLTFVSICNLAFLLFFLHFFFYLIIWLFDNFDKFVLYISAINYANWRVTNRLNNPSCAINSSNLPFCTTPPWDIT